MAEFRVHPKLRPALIQLAEQSDEALAELSKLLESNPDVLTSRQAAFDHAAELTKFGDDAYSIVEAIVPLLYYKASSAKSTAEVLREIIPGLKSGEKNEPKLPSASVPKLQKHLERILELSDLTLKAKALALATDYQRLFSDVKVLSDIRPVFGERVSDAPLGAVVIHSLRIGFAEDGEEREFFVTLDSKDLRELQAGISRALEKDATLRRFMEQSKLQLFETST